MAKDEELELLSMEELLAQEDGGLDKVLVEEGAIITAVVAQVNKEAGIVFCSIPGVKAEGEISLEEFTDVPEINEETQVLLKKKEGRDGKPILSKKEASKNTILASLSAYQVNQTPIKGTIIAEVNGGFKVKIDDEVEAFLPASLLDVYRVENTADYIGKEFDFLVDRVQYGRLGLNIVVSRRGLLEQGIVEKRKAFFESINVGDVVKGNVKNFTPFGVFINLGGFDGLLHINDISWGHVKKIDSLLTLNQELELKVIKLDYDHDRINLSLKHMKDDPWETFEDRYSLDQKIKGKISKLTKFGAFVELEEGIEGLIHISELSWIKKIHHPDQVLSVDQEVECLILGYDMEGERISLGLKQTLENPWDTVVSEFPLNSKQTGKVMRIVNSGAIIELANGMEGFLPLQELSWTQRVKSANHFFKEEDTIECVVLEVDAEEHKIRLGYKQLSDDPWTNLVSKYSVGSEMEGEVRSITDFGLFVKVDGDIEGLIHKNQLLDSENGEDPIEKFQVGDSIKSVIISIDAENQKLSLSVKQLGSMREKRDTSRYLDDNKNTDESATTLADFMTEK